MGNDGHLIPPAKKEETTVPGFSIFGLGEAGVR